MFKNIIKVVNRSNYVVQVRFNPRWSHRRPVRVLTPEEYEQEEKKYTSNKNTIKQKLERNDNYPEEDIIYENQDYFETTEKVEKKNKNKQKGTRTKSIDFKILTTSYQKPSPKTTTDMFETNIDNDGNFKYEKITGKSKEIAPILTSIKSSKEKQKHELILLEGKRLIKDALDAGCILKYLLFSRSSDIEFLRPSLPKIGAKLYKMPYKDLQVWSDLTTNPGIMGIFKTPEVELHEPKSSIPLTIVCDNVREPGNLGAILRVCAAAGCHKIILLKGCANLWDTKVLRSGMGAHFKVQIHRNQTWEKLQENLTAESKIFLADNNILTTNTSDVKSLKKSLEQLPILPYYGVDFNTLSNVVLVVGGETEGISDESYTVAAKFGGGRINIPLTNDVESLNVGTALGVIAFEIRKQLLTKKQ